MSISSVTGSSIFGSGFDFSQVLNSSRNKGMSSDDIANAIVGKDDADGDGLLSLEETPLDEDRFSAIDTDGDGFVSAEELSASAMEHVNGQNSMIGQLTLAMQGIDLEKLASSIVKNADGDGDGLLSLEETPLDEDTFNSIDADGDGFITADELSANMGTNMAEGMPAPPPEAQAAAGSGGGEQASAANSSGSESEEEYDEYDVNEDGVVTYDELLQAFDNGDSSLTSLFQNTGVATPNLTSRLAMKAYQAQMA
ncbi:EF-hand domain-containing protein [Desulfovibrio inopinatus]|uniref:EF-hand domain-containing protein n=1 Tax=Desulfovibrio inopinatus TaxID=102109 RepID=UPI00048563F0|nr:EF-hand domain-containing protein [Desulfovibrio inopinatus]